MHDINLRTVDAGEEEVAVDREGRAGGAVERDVDGVGIVGGVRGVPRTGNGEDLIVAVNVGGEEGVLPLLRRIPLHNHISSRASKSGLWSGYLGKMFFTFVWFVGGRGCGEVPVQHDGIFFDLASPPFFLFHHMRFFFHFSLFGCLSCVCLCFWMILSWQKVVSVR